MASPLESSSSLVASAPIYEENKLFLGKWRASWFIPNWFHETYATIEDCIAAEDCGQDDPYTYVFEIQNNKIHCIFSNGANEWAAEV